MMKIMLSGFVLLSAMIYSVAAQSRPKCGGSLSATGATKTFGTPNYPANYPSHLNCVWVIRPSIAGKQVEAQFTKVKSERCCDFLRVRDGDSASSQELLLPLSGDGNTTWNFVSTFNALYIEFKSDDSIEKKGFKVEYRMAIVSDSTCGGTINLDRTDPSLISSPNYSSGKYPSNSYCLWTIVAPFGRQVNLTITKYQIESCCDSLVIRDGTKKSSKFIGFLFGTEKKIKSYVSTGGKLFLRFRSDASLEFKGFIGSARSVFVPKRPVLPTQRPFPSGGCQKTLLVPRTGHGTFTTPFYPNRHPGNLECFWVLIAPTGQKVHLWFGLIDTEECCDWVKVRDGRNYDSPKIDVISGSPFKNLLNYVSTSRVMRVEYDTDGTLNKRGFRAYYETYKSGDLKRTSKCGGRLKAASKVQYFSSPNFPKAYDVSSRCTWRITSPSGTQVKLVFLTIHTEKKFDTLTVYDGSFFGKQLIKFTGTYLTVYTVTSSSNGIRVVLSTDALVSFAGFRASYVIQRGLSTKEG